MKRALLVLGATALAVGGPSFAIAAPAHSTAKKKKTNHALTLIVAIAGISPDGTAPVSGRQVYAGTVDGTIAGKANTGAVRGTNNYSGTNFQATSTTFGPLGSTNATLSGTGARNSDGSASFHGTGTIVGGTGIYKGASGTFTFTFKGNEPKNGTVATFTVSGTVKY